MALSASKKKSTVSVDKSEEKLFEGRFSPCFKGAYLMCLKNRHIFKVLILNRKNFVVL
jgi:hypothetical protein